MSGFGLVLNWQIKLKLGWKFVFGVESITEVDSSNSAISVNLNPQSLNVVGSVGPSSEVRQIKLNLVPSVIESHWHGANKRLDSSGGLVVGSSESPSYVLVVENLDFEGEAFFKILDDHDQKWKFNTECLLGVRWACDVGGRNVGSFDF